MGGVCSHEYENRIESLKNTNDELRDRLDAKSLRIIKLISEHMKKEADFALKNDELEIELMTYHRIFDDIEETAKNLINNEDIDAEHIKKILIYLKNDY